MFIAGGTGYIGWPLIRELLERGHTVRALARAGSERYDRLPLVRARPRTSLALHFVTAVLALRANPLNSRRRSPPGPNHAFADDTRFGAGHRETRIRGAYSQCSPDSCCPLLILQPSEIRVSCWNYESACTWDIFLLPARGEMLNRLRKCAMSKPDYLDDVHVRIMRVAEDLRAIQKELNCAAMQAPGDPELLEVLTQLPELESLDVLKSALDQMRHFLWFYVQVMTSDTEVEQREHSKSPKKPPKDAAFMERLNHVTDAALLRYFAEGKNRKPN